MCALFLYSKQTLHLHGTIQIIYIYEQSELYVNKQCILTLNITVTAYTEKFMYSRILMI